MMNKDINFFEKLSSNKREKEKKAFIRKVVLITMIPVVLLAAVSFYILSANLTYQISMNGVIEYIEEPTRKAQFIEVNKVIQDALYVSGYKEDLLNIKSIIARKLKPDKATMDLIYACMPKDTKFKTLEMEQEQVTMTCMSKSSTAAAEFVRKLREKEVFKGVSYNGWVNDKEYTFTISLYYKGEQVDENENK